MNCEPSICVAFTGHRTYDGSAAAALRRTVGELYERGFRVFLSGMAVGFDLAAAEAVLDCRGQMPGLQLVAVVPFAGQERRFPATERERFGRVLAAADQRVVLSDAYHAACYHVRNDYLVAHASVLVAWHDGSAGGTHYTVARALSRGLELLDLHPRAPRRPAAEPRLF